MRRWVSGLVLESSDASVTFRKQQLDLLPGTVATVAPLVEIKSRPKLHQSECVSSAQSPLWGAQGKECSCPMSPPVGLGPCVPLSSGTLIGTAALHALSSEAWPPWYPFFFFFSIEEFVSAV